MRSRTLGCFTLVACLGTVLTDPVSAAEAVCTESISIATEQGTLTGQLIGETDVSEPFLFPLLFPLPWIAPVRTAVGTYQFSDGRLVTTDCVALAD